MSYISNLFIGQKWIHKSSKKEDEVSNITQGSDWDNKGISRYRQNITMSSGYQGDASSFLEKYAPSEIFITKKYKKK